MQTTRKIGVAVIRDGAILLCRKRGLSALILPGGKIEQGEEPLDCLRRELSEELGEVKLVNPRYLGEYCDVMAGDSTRTVEIVLYSGELEGCPKATSEISELVWFGLNNDWAELAPSLANKILPDLRNQGLLT